MAKAFSELVDVASELKPADIFCITQGGTSHQIDAEIIEYTINSHVVRTQEDFNNLLTRVAANQYKIKDGIYAVSFRPLAGGYKMHGGTSPLSGGDLWGYIETNQCTRVFFDPNTFIDMGTTIGYFKPNTANSIIENVYIKGDDTGSADAIVQSFLISANDIRLIGCITSNRFSNVDYYGFNNLSAGYRNNILTGCKVHTVKNGANFIYGIGANMFHVIDCSVYNINSPTSFIYGIFSGRNIKGCNVYNITGGGIVVGIEAELVVNCVAEDLTGTSNTIGMQGSFIVNSRADTITGNGSGFYNSENVLNCQAISCNNGFELIDAVGYCLANANTINGFNNCKAMGHNRSTANGTNYLNCFADWAGTVPVADTAAGGYNG